MAKRDLIAEIREKNNRASRRFLRGRSELTDIEISALSIEGERSPLFALHLIGIAACLEVCVRESIKILIDFGSPYLDRVEKFKEHLRFDFTLTKALSSRQISFGDLVAHLLPVSGVEQIVSHLDALLEEDDRVRGLRWHLSEIRAFEEPDEDALLNDVWAPPSEPDIRPHLVKDAGSLLSEIAKIFEIRHVAAHEANFGMVNKETLSQSIKSANVFIEAMYEIVEQILHPKASRSGIGISLQNSMQAGKVAMSVEAATERIAKKLTSKAFEGNDPSREFREGHAEFEKYVTGESNFKLSIYRPVNGNAMRNIEANVRRQIYEQRLEYLLDLEKELDHWIGLFPTEQLR